MYVLDSPYHLANWRPLVHWLLGIPHLILVHVMQSTALVIGIFNWLHLLFTGHLNPGLYSFTAGYKRYRARVNTFLLGFSEQYPPFDFEFFPDDNGVYPPARLNLPHVPEHTPRKALLNFLRAIPHYVVFLLIAVAAVVVLVIGSFAVLFTGRWPQDMRDFIVRFIRYGYRIWVYVAMVELRYPQYGL